MRSDFRVGDRLVWRGLPMRQEESRRAIVIAVYRGLPSATDPGVPLMDVQFENGETKTSCINRVGVFSLEPINLGGIRV